MSRGGRIGFLAGVAALSALLLPGPAQAAYEQTGLAFLPIPDGTQAAEVLECPKGVVVSGGADGRAEYADVVLLNSSYPTPVPAHDGWTAYVDNYAGGEPTSDPAVTGICDKSGKPADYAYKEDAAGLTVDDDDQAGATLQCGGGKPVVGGGARVSGGYDAEQYLTTSAPADGDDDGDKRPDNGWHITVNNDEDAGGADAVVDLFAICDRKRPSSAYTYVRKGRKVGDGAQKGRYTACPNGDPSVGGGVESHSQYKHGLYIHATTPDYVDDRSFGWSGAVSNYSTADGKTRKITVHAICKD